MKKTFDDEKIYVRINTKGFIPEAQLVGPVKGTFVTKAVYLEMVRTKKDVELRNPNACPAFAAKMKALKEAVESGDAEAILKVVNQPESEYAPEEKEAETPDLEGPVVEKVEEAPVEEAPVEKDVVPGPVEGGEVENPELLDTPGDGDAAPVTLPKLEGPVVEKVEEAPVEEKTEEAPTEFSVQRVGKKRKH